MENTMMIRALILSTVLLATPALADSCPEAQVRLMAEIDHTDYRHALTACQARAFEAGAEEAGRQIQQNKIDDLERRLNDLENKSD
jgi:hypothetical protein